MERRDYVVQVLTPKWFDFMQWVLVTGLLQYLSKRLNSTGLLIFATISTLLLVVAWGRLLGDIIVAFPTGGRFEKYRRTAEILVWFVLTSALLFAFLSAKIAIDQHGTSGEILRPTPTPKPTPTVPAMLRALPKR